MEAASTYRVAPNSVSLDDTYKRGFSKCGPETPGGPPKMLSGDKVGVSQRPHDLEHLNILNANVVRKSSCFLLSQTLKRFGGRR